MNGFCNITTYDYDEQKYTTVDAYTEYGILFEKGTYEALFSFPEVKERYEYDWGGSHGLEIEESAATVLKAQSITLPIAIVAKGKSEFWSRYMAFRNLVLGTTGYIELTFPSIGRRFKLRYTGGGAISILGNVSGTALVGMKFKLNFSDDFPRVEPLLPDSEFNDTVFNEIIID